LTACSSKTKDQKNGEKIQTAQTAQTTETKADSAITVYKKMKGTIGNNLAITMQWIRTGARLNGTYFYNKIGLPLHVNGQVSPSGEISLSETNEKLEETGRFAGTYTSAEVFEGTWTNPKTSKSLPFKLSETKEGIANIAFEKYHKENCTTRDKSKNKPANEKKNTDDLCSQIDIKLIKISTDNQAASDLINKSIVRIISGSVNTKCESINEFLNSIDKLGDDEYLAMDFDCSVTTNDNNILCIRIDEYEFSGGAHPNRWRFYHNYDLTTGNEIKLEQILKANYSDVLNRIGEKIFTNSAGNEGWNFEKWKFKFNDNFAMTTGGLLFVINTYEVGAYLDGAPEVFIPYKEIEDLINPSGPVRQLRRK
jgi:hypothetical protein